MATAASQPPTKHSNSNGKLSSLCTSFSKVKEIVLADANVIMAQAHKDGTFNLSRIPRFAKRTSQADGSDTPTPSSPHDVLIANHTNLRRTASCSIGNTRDSRRLGSTLSAATPERASKKRQTLIEPVAADDSPLRRRRTSFGSDGYCSSSTTPVNVPSPRHKRISSSDASAMLREGFVRYTPQVKTNPVYDPGRVQVFVRVRPLTHDEVARGEPLAIASDEEETSQLRLFDGKSDRAYQFDGVLPVIATNKEVFQTVGQPLVYSALNGFNGILMCYGQTGTGKTYTLMSPDGMSVRVVYKCFNIINRDRSHKYTVTCSYLQIYQDKIYDLLNTTRTVNLSLRQHPKEGVYVENLTEYVVHSPKEVLNLLRVGRRRLVFAETQMNRASSRSHAICQLKIFKEKGKDRDMRAETPRAESSCGWTTPQADLYNDDDMDSDTDVFPEGAPLLDEEEEDDSCLNQLTDLDDSVTSVKGKIYLCDLAGSERIKRTKAQGERLQEAQHINSSLLELGNVIQALAEGNRSHVPFRNSTLTRLLQEGLSGNCKTKLVVCVAPTIKDVHETKCSLNFGSRAMKVQVTAHVNYEVDYKKLAECLASKLEILEEEWNVKRADLESVIAILKTQLASRAMPSSDHSYMLHAGDTTGERPVVSQHAQALLILELMTLQMFYSVERDRNHINAEDIDERFTSMFTVDDKQLVMGNMEKLTDVLLDSLRGVLRGDQSSASSSTTSSSVTSPECCDSGNAYFHEELPCFLEPLSHFLSLMRESPALKRRYHGNPTCVDRASSLVGQLTKLKKLVAHAAVGFLKELIPLSHDHADSSPVGTVEQLLTMISNPKGLSLSVAFDEQLKRHLEQALYFLLMDKALLACVALLQSFMKSDGVDGDNDVARRLVAEQNESRRLGDELTQVISERDKSEGRVRRLEEELGCVVEKKTKIEDQLNRIGEKNAALERKITEFRGEKESLEKRVVEIDNRRLQLEQSMRTTENNNAKKERAIVDLKNQKVALDSIMATLKEELAIMEKEKTKEHEERRLLEAELEEVKDRNIILETEWSCCKEENGLLETELMALEDDKAMLEEELARYKDDVQMLEEALTVLEKQACTYKSEVQSLKQKEEKLISTIRAEKEKFTRDVTALKQEMASLKGEKRKFQRDISLSRADRSNTERAYSALKGQNDGLKGELTGVKQTERRILKEITALRSDKQKLEREVTSLKTENAKLRSDLVAADSLKTEVKLLQKNEEKLTVAFKTEQERLAAELHSQQENFALMEADLKNVEEEKERLMSQLRRYEKVANSLQETCQSSDPSPNTPCAEEETARRQLVHGSLARKSVCAGHVSEVEGKVLDLQRRLAFFMTEKDEVQKELVESRDRNAQLLNELKNLEGDTSTIQTLLTTLSDDKSTLECKLRACEEHQTILATERNRLEREMARTSEQKSSLQTKLNGVLETNHVLEVDKKTLQKSVTKLNAESCVLTVENRHINKELTRSKEEVKSLNTNLSSASDELNRVRMCLEHANEQRHKLGDRLASKNNENSLLKRELESYKSDEVELASQLAELASKFKLVDRNLHRLVAEKNTIVSDSTLEKYDACRHAEAQKRENERLKQEVGDLRTSVDNLTENLNHLRLERQEIEAAFKETIAMSEHDDGFTGALSGSKETILRFVGELRDELSGLRCERDTVTAKLARVSEELSLVGEEKNELATRLSLRATRQDQEQSDHQSHIDQLYRQLEHALKEKRAMEGEVDFIKQQNAELRAEVAIILEENDKLEGEIDELEHEYERQESELETSAEETKQLLRQLCAVETKNLQLSTVQSNMQDETERLSEAKNRLESERASADEERTTFRDRMLVAELEVCRLKGECDQVMRQRNVLITELKHAKKNRDTVSSELQDLARALSPLKAEVRTAFHRSTVPQTDAQDSSDPSAAAATSSPRGSSASAASYDVTEIQCGNEPSLRRRLIRIKNDKANLEKRMLGLITDLDCADSASPVCADVDAMKGLVSGLVCVEKERLVLEEELSDIGANNAVLAMEVSSLRGELMSAQEGMTLAIIERLQFSSRLRRLGNDLSEARLSVDPSSVVGVDVLQSEIEKLRRLVGDFECVGAGMLEAITKVTEQLNKAENNLANIEQFKGVIEKNLLQYKQRNASLESQLKHLYADLKEMSKHGKDVSVTKTTQIMMGAASLQEHTAELETNLSVVECENNRLLETSKDLAERCGDLTDETGINNETQAHLEHCLQSQKRKIERLERESELIASDRDKLRKKVTVFREDKKRIMEDFSRLNGSLGAYARYNNELERKLESFKDDVGRLEETAMGLRHDKEAVNGMKKNGESDSVLCETCRQKLIRKFSGLDRNAHVLGDELFDCIEDNLSMETAILSFMDQRTHLEREMRTIDSDRAHLEHIMASVGSIPDRSASQSLTGCEWNMECGSYDRSAWSSGVLSSRSKSMTSHSGDSFVGDFDNATSTPLRSHTALGICQTSSTSLNHEITDKAGVTSLNSFTSSGISIDPLLLNSPSSPVFYCLGVNTSDNEADSCQSLVDSGSGHTLKGGFQSLPEERMCGSNEAMPQQRIHKSRHLSGFLKKFRSSRRKRSFDNDSTSTL